MTTANEVRAVAATVWDQDSHSEADMAFLDAVSRAEGEWHDQLHSANVEFGGGSEAWQAVKRMATRRRDERLVKALAVLEAADDLDFTQQAAE